MNTKNFNTFSSKTCSFFCMQEYKSWKRVCYTGVFSRNCTELWPLERILTWTVNPSCARGNCNTNIILECTTKFIPYWTKKHTVAHTLYNHSATEDSNPTWGMNYNHFFNTYTLFSFTGLTHTLRTWITTNSFSCLCCPVQAGTSQTVYPPMK